MAKASRGDETTVSAQELARLLGLSATTVSKLGGDGLLIRAARGRYKLWPSVRGYVERLRQASDRKSSPSVEARAELLKLQSARIKFQMEVEQGQWMRTAHVETEYRAAWGIVRAHLLAFPSRVAGRLPHLSRDDIERIDEEGRALLTSLADPKTYGDGFEAEGP
jgi:phage terminase Nu1 subunit (DNA packaging protein)